VSLFVGGMRIMNIMLVSVTERRARSACVKRWARRASTSCSVPRRSLVLCLVGGILGIIFGALGASRSRR